MLILGNWKMNMVVADAVRFSERLTEIKIPGGVEVGVIPSHVCLYSVADKLNGSKIEVGAQNCYFEDEGAFTGETSPIQLKDLGCRWCLVGHSERRQLFGDSDEIVRRKVVALLRHDIKPVLCIGETLGQKNAGRTFGILSSQLMRVLEGLRLGSEFIIAYEPIWAIGTGIVAKPEQVRETISAIREIVTRMHKQTKFKILYGGSVNENNARSLLKSRLDGFLVGGASLSVSGFSKIISETEFDL